MKVVTASNGKKTVKISKSEWETIGKKHGWMKTAAPRQNVVLPAQIQVISGGGQFTGQQYPFTLQLDVAGYSISLPQNGEMVEVYQAVQEQIGQNEVQTNVPPQGTDPTNQI